MNAKTRVLEYAQSTDQFIPQDAAEALGLSTPTIRKAITSLVEEGELVRHESGILEKKKRITRTHKKPRIEDLLKPKFDAALEGIDIIIPEDATKEGCRKQKAAIKAAMDTVTYENTAVEVAACKGFSKYSQSHLAWYKSRYLNNRRKSIQAEQETEVTAEAV